MTSPGSTNLSAVDPHSLLRVLIEATIETFAGAMAAATDGDRADALRTEMSLLGDTVEAALHRREALALMLRDYDAPLEPQIGGAS